MRILILISILTFSLSANAQKFVKHKVTENIKLKLPQEFVLMTDEDKEQRYQSARIPIALFTDNDRLAEFGINRSYSVWQEGDMKMLKEFYQASIVELFDKVEFIDQGIKTINKRDYVFFEFESVVYPENKFQRNITKYTYVMYTLAGGTTYVFNFTSELSVKEKWQESAHKIMESIKLK
ncbi:MAG: hypothetical protein ABFS32_15445 [Bacteroidota bacterium]